MAQFRGLVLAPHKVGPQLDARPDRSASTVESMPRAHRRLSSTRIWVASGIAESYTLADPVVHYAFQP